MKIVIPGGTGQIGTMLSRAFHAAGHEVLVLSRGPGNAAWRVMMWDGETLGDWATELEGADVVINLAGRSVNCRYTPENRRLIKESRVKATRVVKVLENGDWPRPPVSFAPYRRYDIMTAPRLLLKSVRREYLRMTRKIAPDREGIHQRSGLVRKDNESRLIERAKACDAEALSELYCRHADAVFRYVYYRVGDRQIAEDLVGDVFVRALEGLPSYQHTGTPFEAWLYRIAQARVIDHYRRQKVRRAVALDKHLADGEEASPDWIAAQGDEERRAWEALTHLTDDQQQVLSLRFIAGYSTAEVATLLGKTEGAVKALQSRALASLRRLLEAEP